MSDTAEVLILQSTLDAHDSMQTDLTGHAAKEASWSVLHVELMHQAEHTCHLTEVCVRDGSAECPTRMPRGYPSQGAS
jgi:hypothetical protein